MSQKSSLYRTVEILKRVNEGEKLCIDSLALEYDVNERTIQRDFKLIREIFGEFMNKDGRCYQAYKKILLDEILHATDLMTLANIALLFDVTQKKSLISPKSNTLIKNAMSLYEFKSKPFEIIKDKEQLKKLEHAIKFKRELSVAYQSKKEVIERIFHPYRIIFLNENFYIVGKNISNGYFESLRIALIKEVNYTSKGFYKEPHIEKFIDSIQTPWAKFGNPEEEIRLLIDSSIAKYFKLKKYLPSQTINHTYPNGNLEISYRVTNLKEVEELIIKWLPHITILEPIELNNMIQKVLLKKLEGCQTNRHEHP